MYDSDQRGEPFVAFTAAVSATTLSALTFLNHSLAQLGLDLTHAQGKHPWSGWPILVICVGPTVAVWKSFQWIINRYGLRPFERTVWAMLSLGIFSLGLFETRPFVQGFDLLAAPFFIGLQTFCPNWTLSEAFERWATRFFELAPGLAWLSATGIEASTSATKWKRVGTLALFSTGSFSTFAVPLGMLPFGIIALPFLLLGLALCALAFIIGINANDKPDTFI